GDEAGRLVGLRRGLEDAERAHDALAVVDQVVALEAGQLAQLGDEGLADLAAELVGAILVDTLVAPDGRMHVMLLTSFRSRQESPERASPDARMPAVRSRDATRR